jgi:hypothetical protein
MQKLTIGVALGALMVSGALAQTPPSPSAPPASPPSATAPAQPSAGKADLVTSQKPDQWLASKFRGTDVVGADNQKIGDVSDILFDKTGKIEAYVISVGGFLGVGAKSVAVAPASFDVVPGQNGAADQLKLSMNKEELTTAQNFTPSEPPRATTGAGSRGGAMGNGPRPSTNTPPTGR